MGITASEAAKLVGMSKPGIINAIKTGKLSATRGNNNQYIIEPVELFRVYAPVSSGVKSEQELNGNLPVDQSDALRVENEQLRQRLADKDDVIDDLRSRLDAEAEERRKLTMILTDKQHAAPPPSPQPVSWWRKLLTGKV